MMAILKCRKNKTEKNDQSTRVQNDIKIAEEQKQRVSSPLQISKESQMYVMESYEGPPKEEIKWPTRQKRWRGSFQ